MCVCFCQAQPQLQPPLWLWLALIFISPTTHPSPSMFIRGVQNVKIFDMKLALWFFPLHFTSGVTTKKLSHLAYVECPPLWAPIIKR